MMTPRNPVAAWRPLCAVLTLLALSATAAARAPSKTEVEDAKARHRVEVALCNAGQTNQSRSDCLADADGALRVALRGDADDDYEPYERNRRLRCLPLPDELRHDCLARMDGLGSTSGSVAAGGIYRELVTIEVGPVPDPAAEPPDEAIEPPAALRPAP